MMQRRETTGEETTKADTSKTEWRAFLLGVALLKISSCVSIRTDGLNIPNPQT